MTRERIENGGVTTLNGGIDASTTTVTVSDASVMSTSPQFRIIVESELMLVTGVSGNDLTVVRGAEGTSAAAHSNGVTAAQIITRDGMRRLHRDWNNPYFDDANRYPYQLLDSSNATLTSSSFTQTNIGSVTISNLDSGGISHLAPNNGGANSLRILERSYTPSITVTAAIHSFWYGNVNDVPTGGIGFRDSSGGRATTIARRQSHDIYVIRWASSTSFNATHISMEEVVSGDIIWFQIEDDNANHYFRISQDGINFIELYSETRDTYIASPDRVFNFTNNVNADFDMVMNVVGWIEE